MDNEEKMNRTVDEDIRYMRFPKGPNSVSLG
ncbi:hypothetical protein T4B_15312 [Trichinella pseudospiralis]|uniref:Uncharacterized protein n=1 Tax=Trichinella pseudospiralis TaxID=6337 RepID=A0A0V1G7B7_TRIPS|nr:hypothetical protein T4C_2502 [Trichinella pseudospiralis]KRY94838.1 hypothetical protein T4B_15312 [Trichinella pseudospiralis]